MWVNALLMDAFFPRGVPMLLRLYDPRRFPQALMLPPVLLDEYHFWMRKMTPIKRNSGNQYPRRKTEKYRGELRRKISAYHRRIQVGLIVQGLVQCMATIHPSMAWAEFESWIRTIRPGIPPSEQVTAIAMRNALPEFIADSPISLTFVKFLRQRIDTSRAEASRMFAVNE